MTKTGYAGSGQVSSERFSRDVADWVAGANERLAGIVRGTVRELAARIGERTPVTSGRTRANWRAGLDAPDTGTTNSTDYAAAERKAAGVIARFDPLRHRSVYLTNALPHVHELEYGGGGKVPRGMVRVTAAEFAGIVRDQVRRARTRGAGLS